MNSGMQIDSALFRCAVCGAERIRHWFDTEFGSIGRCGQCGQVLRSDKPQRGAQVALHQHSNLHELPYAMHSEAASHELAFYRRFLDLCEKSSAHRRLLDVGCGTGEFLKLAAERGFEVMGIEPIAELRRAAEMAIGDGRIESRPIEEAEFEDECFDVVTLWDAIEHLVDPRGALVRLHRALKPDGLLGVATINHASLMYVIYHIWRWTAPSLARRFGSMLYNPFHTYYFSKQSLAQLIENAGFEVVEQRGYEFPLSRLEVGAFVKFGMRGLYLLQGAAAMEGEQYLFARKRR